MVTSSGAVARSLHEHWVFYLVEASSGRARATAIVLPRWRRSPPPPCSAAVLVSGVVGLVTTFWMRQAPGFWWR